jgi:cytochrome c551/c552
MLRSIAELVAYGTLAVLFAAASLTPQVGDTASSAPIGNVASNERPSSELVERGALLFATKGCVGCHTHAFFPSARMQVGPDLTAVAVRAATRVTGLDARAYIRQSLREPGAYRAIAGDALMPDIALTDLQIESLTAFLLSSAR